MITQYTSALIPDSVVDGKFPKADEVRLAALGTQWRRLDSEMTSESSAVTAESRTVFANWTGSGADTAYGQITAVTKFASSVSNAGTTIAKGCAMASSYVANTKAGINVVLVHLDNLTKEQILIGLASPLLIPACPERILNLRTRAKSLISAYSEALIAAMAAIPFSVAVQPRPSGGTGSASSSASSSGAVEVSTTTSPPASGTGSSGGTASAGGKATTTGATPASNTAVSAGPITDGPASIVAGWTGGLAAFQVADVASAIAKAPQSKDPSKSPDATAKPSGADPASTDTSGTPGHASPGGSNPTGRAPATAPADGSGLMTDKGSLYTDMGQAAPQTLTPGATTAGAPGNGTLQPTVAQSITNQVVGTGSGHDVARSLDHVSSWTNPGPNSATPLTLQPAPSTPAAVAPPAGQAGVPLGGAGTTTGGQQSWTPAHPAGAGNPSPVPVSAPNPPPVGTVAAGGDTFGGPVTHDVAPAPVPLSCLSRPRRRSSRGHQEGRRTSRSRRVRR